MAQTHVRQGQGGGVDQRQDSTGSGDSVGRSVQGPRTVRGVCVGESEQEPPGVHSVAAPHSRGKDGKRSVQVRGEEQVDCLDWSPDGPAAERGRRVVDEEAAAHASPAQGHPARGAGGQADIRGGENVGDASVERPAGRSGGGEGGALRAATGDDAGKRVHAINGSDPGGGRRGSSQAIHGSRDRRGRGASLLGNGREPGNAATHGK